MGSKRIFNGTRIFVISLALSSNAPLLAWNPFSSLFHGATIESTSTLPNTPLQDLGNTHLTASELLRAKTNGLRFPELPSIGSGLAHISGNDYVGINDRGPNGKPVSEGSEKARRTFPLPRFCPSIIRFHLDGPSIMVTESIPLSDSHGNLITGLSNNPGEENLYDVSDALQPLPLDPNGVDPEAIRILPDGRYLISEEYGPSILVVSPKGQVLMRYTPAGKPLSGATYPVQAILPAEFSHRTQNQGFESLALSRDGRFAYAILQSPMLEQKPATHLETRIVRALKMDFSDPLHAFPVAEFLLKTSRGPKSAAKGKREKMSISDAEWIGTDKVIALERSKSSTRLIELDFSKATNILGLPDTKGLHFENPKTDLAAEGIKLARNTEIISTRSLKSIGAQKLEGLAIIDSTHIAVSNDNDFGLGDNENGEPSHVWIVKLSHPLHL